MKGVIDMEMNSCPVTATQGVICDAFECLAKATQEIKLQVGTLGKIRINICDKCQSKFIFQAQKDTSIQVTPIEERPQYSHSMVGRREQKYCDQSTTRVKEPHLNDKYWQFLEFKLYSNSRQFCQLH